MGYWIKRKLMRTLAKWSVCVCVSTHAHTHLFRVLFNRIVFVREPAIVVFA